MIESKQNNFTLIISFSFYLKIVGLFILGFLFFFMSCNINNTEIDTKEEQLFPNSLKEYLENLLQGYSLPSSSQISVASLYPEIESEFHYQDNLWKDYMIAADFTENGYNDYALILAKAEISEITGDSIYHPICKYIR